MRTLGTENLQWDLQYLAHLLRIKILYWCPTIVCPTCETKGGKNKQTKKQCPIQYSVPNLDWKQIPRNIMSRSWTENKIPHNIMSRSWTENRYPKILCPDLGLKTSKQRADLQQQLEKMWDSYPTLRSFSRQTSHECALIGPSPLYTMHCTTTIHDHTTWHVIKRPQHDNAWPHHMRSHNKATTHRTTTHDHTTWQVTTRQIGTKRASWQKWPRVVKFVFFQGLGWGECDAICLDCIILKKSPKNEGNRKGFDH